MADVNAMREKIRVNFEFILEELSDTDTIAAALFGRMAFTRNDAQEVHTQTTDFKKTRKLLYMLSSKPDAIMVFMEVIKGYNNHVYRKINDTTITSSREGSEHLEGGATGDRDIMLKEAETLMAYLSFCLPIYVEYEKGENTDLDVVVVHLQELCHRNNLPHTVTNDIVISAIRDRFPGVMINNGTVHDLAWIHMIQSECIQAESCAGLGSAPLASLCIECKKSRHDVKCFHCGMMLCQNCQATHLVFEAMRQSIEKLQVALQKASLDMTDTRIHLLGQAIDREVDNAIDPLLKLMEARRQQLKCDAHDVISSNLGAHSTWMQEVEPEITEAQSYCDSTTDQIGKKLGKHIGVDHMKAITRQCGEMVTKIEIITSQSPALVNPALKCNSYTVASVIKEFGCIDTLPDDDEHFPVSIDVGPIVALDRPRVIGQRGTRPGEFKKPSDVAVCPVSGRVVVADNGNCRIQVFDERFAHVMDIDRDGSGQAMKLPGAVAVNRSGEIIVLDLNANAVLIYEPTGSYSRRLPGSWRKPVAIAVDDDGTLFICERNTYQIKVVDKDGRFLREFGGPGTDPGQFSAMISHIAIHRDLILVSASGRIHQFTKDGEFIRLLEANKVLHARGMAATSTQDLIVVDERGFISVLRGDTVVACFGEDSEEFWRLRDPFGVAVSRNGQVIVANRLNHNVLVYDLTKKIYMT